MIGVIILMISTFRDQYQADQCAISYADYLRVFTGQIQDTNDKSLYERQMVAYALWDYKASLLSTQALLKYNSDMTSLVNLLQQSLDRILNGDDCWKHFDAGLLAQEISKYGHMLNETPKGERLVGQAERYLDSSSHRNDPFYQVMQKK